MSYLAPHQLQKPYFRDQPESSPAWNHVPTISATKYQDNSNQQEQTATTLQQRNKSIR